MVEIELVRFLNYLGLIICNLKGEEAPDKYKRPPPSLHSHHNFNLSFYKRSYDAKILLVLLPKLSICHFEAHFLFEQKGVGLPLFALSFF